MPCLAWHRKKIFKNATFTQITKITVIMKIREGLERGSPKQITPGKHTLRQMPWGVFFIRRGALTVGPKVIGREWQKT